MSESYATQFFFQDISKIEAAKSGLKKLGAYSIVKAQLVDGVISNVGRDQSGLVPELTTDIWFARIRITEIIEGTVRVGDVQDVYFGKPGRNIFPTEPNTEIYFVISYRGEDGIGRLAGLPASTEEYAAWERGIWEYEKSRWRR